MKITLTKTFLLLTLLLGSFNMHSQIDCSSFCITGIQQGMSAGYMDVTIHVAGNDTDFVGYPYISYVTDNNGQMTAFGGMFAFLAMGNNSQNYSVQFNPGFTFDPNFTGTMYFSYYNTGTSTTEVCTLAYPCITDGIREIEETAITVCPNPTQGKIELAASGPFAGKTIALKLYNLLGEIIYSRQTEELSAKALQLDLTGKASGIYFLEINVNGKRRLERIELQQ